MPLPIYSHKKHIEAGVKDRYNKLYLKKFTFILQKILTFMTKNPFKFQRIHKKEYQELFKTEFAYQSLHCLDIPSTT